MRIVCFILMGAMALIVPFVGAGNKAAAETGYALGSQEESSPEAMPRRSYCIERVGKINAEREAGEVCEVDASGAGGRMEDLARPDRNTATLIISSPSLEAAGVKTFAFTYNRSDDTPKFSVGVHVMEHVQTYGVDVDDLPDRLAFATDLTGENSMFSVNVPDAAYLRANSGGYDFPGYEIASATLAISTAIDLALEPFEKGMAEKAGMQIGRQYVEGTISFSLIPLGSSGDQYGPATFEFGTTSDWGLAKD